MFLCCRFYFRMENKFEFFLTFYLCGYKIFRTILMKRVRNDIAHENKHEIQNFMEKIS